MKKYKVLANLNIEYEVEARSFAEAEKKFNELDHYNDRTMNIKDYRIIDIREMENEKN